MNPTWESGDVQLYLGDCLEVLPALGSVDAVVTDPPYGIAHPCQFRERKRGKLAECRDYPDVVGDNKPFDPSPFLKWPCCLFGANYYADKLPPSSGWLVWDKLRPDNLDQATCELMWTSFVKGVRRFQYRWNGMIRDGADVLYHPTQKPVALMEWILGLRWTPAGTILDPFMGSGTTGVACVKTGRKFIGIEIDPGYFEIAKKRIQEAQMQPRLERLTPARALETLPLFEEVKA